MMRIIFILDVFLINIFIQYYFTLYRVSQKKRNGGFPVPCELIVLYLFTSLEHLPQKRMIPGSLNLVG